MSNQDKKSGHSGSASFPIPWPRILKWEALLLKHYLLRSVSWEIWRSSRSKRLNFEELKFGETPVKTIQQILTALPPIGPDHVVADLGCGRGRAAFFFHFLSEAKVVGYDVIPPFIATARTLAQETECSGEVLFYSEDFRFLELQEFDVIYACALCFGAETREVLLKKFLQATPGVHIITVGWQPKHERLEPLEHFRARFSWGHTSVTISRLQ